MWFVSSILIRPQRESVAKNKTERWTKWTLNLLQTAGRVKERTKHADKILAQSESVPSWNQKQCKQREHVVKHEEGRINSRTIHIHNAADKVQTKVLKIIVIYVHWFYARFRATEESFGNHSLCFMPISFILPRIGITILTYYGYINTHMHIMYIFMYICSSVNFRFEN